MKRASFKLENLDYTRFGQHIINNINLDLYSGEFVILVGPNGSGKSSLLKILNGVVTPNKGRVLYNNKNLVGQAIFKIAHTIATLTQDLRHSTFSELSVLMNMQLAWSRAQYNHDAHNSQSRENFAAYLSEFNPTLAERLDIQAGHLSGGQRQALALAMCFAHTPQLLLLDEHTSALDPKAADALMVLTNKHIRDKKLTTIMITHSLEHAMSYGDRLIAMGEGRIVADISGDDKQRLSKDELIKLAY
jgi:putative ABC transport system ATP-binding protein